MSPADQEALLAADRFARSLGIRLEEAGPDRVGVAMKIGADHIDGEGRLRAGVAFTLADCAMSLISNANTRSFAVSAHFVITGSATPGETMHATAVAAHRLPGRVTWDVAVRVGDEQVATFTGTTLEVPV